MNQPTLFKPGPRTGNLTDRQQYVYDLLHAEPVGLTATEIGHKIHLQRACQFCLRDRPCKYTADTATPVLVALRKRGLTVRRQRTGLWQLIGLVAPTPTDPSTSPFPDGY